MKACFQKAKSMFIILKRPKILYLYSAFILLALLSGCKSDHKVRAIGSDPSMATEEAFEQSLAYRWAELSLTATANDTERFRPRPTITSRYLALLYISMFDAWTRYDENAIPVYLQNVERVGASEFDESDKEKAISYAAFNALNEYYYSDSLLFRKFMSELGYDPDNKSLDPSTPEGIGNLA